MSEDPTTHGSTVLEQTDDPPPRPGVMDDLRDAVTPRTIGLVFGVLLLQLGFILSYVGAFHAPTPHDVPVAVVAPAQQRAAIVDRLNGIDGSPLKATAASSEQEARAQVERGDRSAAFIVDPSGTRDRLLVASGGGSAVVTAVEQVLTRADASQQRTLTTTDVVPLEDNDARGLTGFYLVVGWIVGGYLVASLLGVAKGSRPATLRRAAIRIGATVPYAVLSGLGGAIVVDQVLGALTGHFWPMWGLGILLVLAAATVTIAFQTVFGVLGIGATVLLFVVLGNPSAGGPYPSTLLPAFWRAIGPWIPNGAGTDAIRRIVYFDGHGVTSNLVVICAYAVVGAVVALAAAHLKSRPRDEADSA